MAQVDLGIGSIGGKDSMSGSFEQLDVPPTLVSFATAVGKVDRVTSPEFKGAGHRVALVRRRATTPTGIAPEAEDALAAMVRACEELIGVGCGAGGFHAGLRLHRPRRCSRCAWATASACRLTTRTPTRCSRLRTAASWWSWPIARELPQATDNLDVAVRVAPPPRHTQFVAAGETLDMAALQEAWESGIESVYPYRSLPASR